MISFSFFFYRNLEGFLTDVFLVIVDIGTNYYVEKSQEQAKEFFDRKIKYVDENMEKITPQLQQKQSSRLLIENELVQKMKAAKLVKPQK